MYKGFLFCVRKVYHLDLGFGSLSLFRLGFHSFSLAILLGFHLGFHSSSFPIWLGFDLAVFAYGLYGLYGHGCKLFGGFLM